MVIERRFERIARQLKTFELVREDPDEPVAGDGSAGDRPRYLGFYSPAGLQLVLEAYGIHQALVDHGLGTYLKRISAESLSHSRLELLLDGQDGDDHRVMDLVTRIKHMRRSQLTGDDAAGETYKMLVVEWLCLQNPRASFTRRRPRLPGQRHPGLGLGRTMNNVILLMGRRLGCDGVLNVPEQYHLAVIYERCGYSFISERHQQEVLDVAHGTRHLHFAVAAWAVARGLVALHEAESATGDDTTWSYAPTEMLVPLSERLESLLQRGRGFLERLLNPRPHRQVEVDLEDLRASLRRDPVEGIDPDRIGD